MPTQSERNALLFFAAVSILGAGWRAARRMGTAEPPQSSRDALSAQIAVVDSVAAASHRSVPRSSSKTRTTAASAIIDVDLATASELEALPRIGPALANRIVADRDSLGPFGSLEGFQRVKGVGPAIARQLAPRVTFSQSPRPTDAATSGSHSQPFEWVSPAPRKRRY